MIHKLFTYLFQKSITRFGNRIKISQPTFLAESLVKKTHRRNIINYFPINSVFRFALYKYRESKETARYLNSNKNCLGPWILPSGDEDDLQLPRERDAAIIQDGKGRRVVAPHVRQLVNINRFVLGVSPRGCLLLSLIGESSSKLAPSSPPSPVQPRFNVVVEPTGDIDSRVWIDTSNMCVARYSDDRDFFRRRIRSFCMPIGIVPIQYNWWKFSVIRTNWNFCFQEIGNWNLDILLRKEYENNF